MGDASAHRDSADQDIIDFDPGWDNHIKKFALDPLEVVFFKYNFFVMAKIIFRFNRKFLMTTSKISQRNSYFRILCMPTFTRKLHALFLDNLIILNSV